MKIVWIVPGIFIAGGIRIIIEYANRLAARRHEVSVLTLKEPRDAGCFPLDVPLRMYSPDAVEGADAVIATGWETVEPTLAVERTARKYYFIQNRESYFRRRPWQQLAVERLYSLPLQPITISHWLADVLRLHGKESFVVHNGLDSNLMKEIPGLRPDRFRILVEGQRALWKRAALSLEAARRVPDAEVWMLAVGKGMEGADKCFSNLTGEDVPRLYSSCHAIVKMSDFEGYPGPQAEAMACGCAVVTAEAPGTNEYCTDGANCLSVTPHDVDAAAKALLKLTDPTVRNRLVQGGKETIRTRFAWEDKVDSMEAILSGDVRPGDMPCPYHSQDEIDEFAEQARPYNLPLFESLEEMGRFTPRKSSLILNRLFCTAERIASRQSRRLQP